MIIERRLYANLNRAVETNDEVLLDYAGPMPDDLTNDPYKFVAIDRFVKYTTTNSVSNTTDEIANHIMQRLMNIGNCQKGSSLSQQNI